jgi:hypothetical protein
MCDNQHDKKQHKTGTVLGYKIMQKLYIIIDIYLKQVVLYYYSGCVLCGL